MQLFLGADHRGFRHKEFLEKKLIDEGYEVVDMGDLVFDKEDDYVDFARRVAESVADYPDSRGVLLCGSGAGVDMVANKIDGVRSALVFDVARAKQAREHEDANVISLPADVLSEDSTYQVVKAFLETPFSGDQRHIRRLEKMEEVEGSN